ncbi:MAG TPA: hypothetical protein VFT75_15725 [Nocardioidaceae bacterium]|jgi:2-phospho-L-lactate guanylyltransferase|nr:hypothetical protein [Nocardioidaceae bacterium]
MQATVMRYDAATLSGAVVLDDGTELPFPAEALAGTGLRLLRPGQRVRIATTGEGDRVTTLQILTLP